MPALGLQKALEPRQVQVPELGPQQALPSELGWGLVERAERAPERGWAHFPRRDQHSKPAQEQEAPT